jgi:hypothetical protein
MQNREKTQTKKEWDRCKVGKAELIMTQHYSCLTPLASSRRLHLKGNTLIDVSCAMQE